MARIRRIISIRASIGLGSYTVLWVPSRLWYRKYMDVIEEAAATPTPVEKRMNLAWSSIRLSLLVLLVLVSSIYVLSSIVIEHFSCLGVECCLSISGLLCTV